MMANRAKDGTGEAEASTGKTPRKTASQAYSTAREKAAAAYDTALERGSAAYSTARTRAAETRQRAVTSLDENPVAALVGGLALGALVGALLPRGRRETELLSGVGGRINETGKRVAAAARDQARETLDDYGLSPDAALEKVNSFFESATKAASSIGTAAKDAVQKQR